MTQDHPIWSASVLTLFPEMFPGPLGHSLAGRALERGIWSLDCYQIRDFAIGKHKDVDGPACGGGVGLVMRADVMLLSLSVTAASVSAMATAGPSASKAAA